MTIHRHSVVVLLRDQSEAFSVPLPSHFKTNLFLLSSKQYNSNKGISHVPVLLLNHELKTFIVASLPVRRNDLRSRVHLWLSLQDMLLIKVYHKAYSRIVSYLTHLICPGSPCIDLFGCFGDPRTLGCFPHAILHSKARLTSH